MHDRKRRIFVTRDIPTVGLDRLRQCAGFDVAVHARPDAIGREALLEGVRGATAIVSLLSDRIDGEVMDAAGDPLVVVANYAVGYDNVDVAAADERGIFVTNTPGVLTEATADLAFGLLLAAARRLVEADAFTRAGRFAGWGPKLMLGMDLHGATLGIVGMGRIGQAVARRARGFGMDLLYCSRRRLPSDIEDELGVRSVGLDELLRRSDAVTLHVPGGPATRHMLGERELGLMRPGAVLVNTARGPVVDESALVAALRDGRLRAAGLDVFEDEPRLVAGLVDLPNVVLAPHIGSATDGTRSKMALMAAENVVAALAGQTPPNAVNRPVRKG